MTTEVGPSEGPLRGRTPYGEVGDQICEILNALRETLDLDTSISAEAAARFVGMGEKQFNKFIDAGIGPIFYEMPIGRRFTRRELIRWREERFRREVKWVKA